MKKLNVLLLCAAAACLLGSRGLAGAEAPKDDKKPSPYAGTYTGTFVASNGAGDQEGDCEITIDDKGNVAGESFNKTINMKATIKGTILKNNKEVIVIEFPNAKSNAYGTISRTDNGGFTGTLIQRSGTTAFSFIEFDMNPKPKAK
jgi:hypothetical protein